MNGEAEKLEVIKLIIETDDKDIIMEVKSLFKNRDKISGTKHGLEEFYNGSGIVYAM